MNLSFHRFETRAGHHLAAGFTLVEVTLATAITAIAVTAILGLVPSSLSNVREAGERAAFSQINRLLLGGVSQVRWSGPEGQDLLADHYQGRRFYFDDQGFEIQEGEARRDGWFAYVAEVRVHPPDVVLSLSDGDAAGGEDVQVKDPHLRRLTLMVAESTDPDFDMDHASVFAVRRHTVLIARAGP